jgi:thiopeptide-type bacteriocin biosynthesis protein
MAATGLVTGWRRTLYEPETVAFGGQPGMDIAHRLFCADSAGIVAYLQTSTPTIGRRELSVLLCTVLFRAAGQEWFECGDVWHRVAQMRPVPDSVPIERLTELTTSLRDLLACDSRPAGPLFGTAGPLSFATPWATAFHQAGRELRAAADKGTLDRGTRDILAYHVIFHWNRLGLSTTAQSVLANAAEAVMLGTGAFGKPVSVCDAASDL